MSPREQMRLERKAKIKTNNIFTAGRSATSTRLIETIYNVCKVITETVFYHDECRLSRKAFEFYRGYVSGEQSPTIGQ